MSEFKCPPLPDDDGSEVVGHSTGNPILLRWYTEKKVEAHGNACVEAYKQWAAQQEPVAGGSAYDLNNAARLRREKK